MNISMSSFKTSNERDGLKNTVQDILDKIVFCVLVFVPCLYIFKMGINIKTTGKDKEKLEKDISKYLSLSRESDIQDLVVGCIRYAMTDKFAYCVDLILIIGCALFLMKYSDFKVVYLVGNKNELIINLETFICFYVFLIFMILLCCIEFYLHSFEYDYINLFGVNLYVWLIVFGSLLLVLAMTNILLWYYDRLKFGDVHSDLHQSITIFGGLKLMPQTLDCFILIFYWLFFNYIIFDKADKHYMMSIFGHIVRCKYFEFLLCIVAILFLSLFIVRIIYNKITDMFMLGFGILFISFTSFLKLFADNNDAKVGNIEIHYLVIVSFIVFVLFALIDFVVFNRNPSTI